MISGVPASSLASMSCINAITVNQTRLKRYGPMLRIHRDPNSPSARHMLNHPTSDGTRYDVLDDLLLSHQDPGTSVVREAQASSAKTTPCQQTSGIIVVHREHSAHPGPPANLCGLKNTASGLSSPSSIPIGFISTAR